MVHQGKAQAYCQSTVSQQPMEGKQKLSNQETELQKGRHESQVKCFIKGLKDQQGVKRIPGIRKPVFLSNSPVKIPEPISMGKKCKTPHKVLQQGKKGGEKKGEKQGKRKGGERRQIEKKEKWRMERGAGGVRERKERRKVVMLELTKIQQALIIRP